jgi:hypothetical protein
VILISARSSITKYILEESKRFYHGAVVPTQGREDRPKMESSKIGPQYITIRVLSGPVKNAKGKRHYLSDQFALIKVLIHPLDKLRLQS